MGRGERGHDHVTGRKFVLRLHRSKPIVLSPWQYIDNRTARLQTTTEMFTTMTAPIISTMLASDRRKLRFLICLGKYCRVNLRGSTKQDISRNIYIADDNQTVRVEYHFNKPSDLVSFHVPFELHSRRLSWERGGRRVPQVPQLQSKYYQLYLLYIKGRT